MLNQSEADEYMATAVPMAVGGVSETFARHVGSLTACDVWSDESGHWLRVRGELEAFPEIEIRYARVILAATGPDMDAEGEASIFSSGFEEGARPTSVATRESRPGPPPTMVAAVPSRGVRALGACHHG